ncbi:alpha/beta fold hydrolase [Parachlamydia sp. AcF125]|uniref:esterase/lipase family protein n=1 Tax=Parachlamydia sp. AcF125 TaxID=2795736 RepID=UPI001BCA1628|nr:alpha/beta fold hydrolase [Parachlamydia sp. AcF125]MBS4167907.1 Lipase EstA [Parachlamydia sp. AcF125]
MFKVQKNSPSPTEVKLSRLPVIKERVRLVLDYIRAFVGDLAVFPFFALAYPFSIADKRPKEVRHLTPILLLHGFAHNPTAWLIYRWYLVKKGYSVHILDFGYPPFASLEEYAGEVKKKAEQIAQQAGTDQLNIIGHSMGGLVASYYATDLAKEGSVKKVVTLGSPLIGTKVATLGAMLRLGKCVEQMKFQSEFVLQQNKKNEESPTQFYHFSSTGDLLIQPNRSALGQNKKAITLQFRGMGHLSFLFSRKVLLQVGKALKT